MPNIKYTFSALLFFISFFTLAQNDDIYSSKTIPENLTGKANAIVRYDSKLIEINSFDDMVVHKKRIVTVYNKYGNSHANTVEFYDNLTNIKRLEVKIYDEFGKEIKKVKKGDFEDQSAVSGATLYSDSRVKYYEYTPVNYPYTIEFVSEVKYKSTAFVPQWRPINRFYQGVEFSEYKIENNSNIEIRKKLINIENFDVEKLHENHFRIKNVEAIKYEEYCPQLSEITPLLKVALTDFNMEGVRGINNNWKDFGKWMYDYLLTGTDELPTEVIDEIKLLTNGVEGKIERAKIVYNYLQEKTRYISVQVGIGGWKPIEAQEVDRLGYGDCKGLSNYTKALLEAVDVPSYYTVVYGGEDIKSLDADFSVTEGNHVILCIPTDKENIFLECTSQSNPFGFIAGFTDDRDVLLVKSDGGEIVHTKVYHLDESLQTTSATINFDESGSFAAKVNIEATGYQYNLREGIQNKTLKDQQLHYKEYWSHINNMVIKDLDVKNDKDDIVFKENLKLNAKNYASKSGIRLILQPNVFNRTTKIPERYIERKHDFEIDRSFKDIDEFVITIPDSFKIEAMNESYILDTKFGSYSYKIEKLEDAKIRYIRQHTMNKGIYNRTDYKAFRDFIKAVVKNDKAKIVLKKIE
jgi:transglutaminase-like putative cysteine protease